MIDTIGKPVNRVDGPLKVTGKATYAAEFDLKNMVHGVLVTSTVTKGRIRNIDSSLAEKSPDVVAVMSYKNATMLHFPGGNNPDSGKYAEKDLLPLQNTRVFYDGQIVALVMAETLEQAQHAAKLVKVDYEAETPVIDFDKNFSQRFQPSPDLHITRGDANAGMNSAAVKMEQTYTTPVFSHNPMEMHATTAVWDGDKVTIYDSTQSVSGLQILMSSMLGIPKENVRIVAYYIGGGFGSKGFCWPNTLLAAMGAKFVNRPVQLMLSREQMFTTAGRRSQTQQKISLGADSSGKLSTIKHENMSETSFVDVFVERSGVATPILYSNPNLDVDHHVVRLNKGTPCPMRAPGEAPGTYGLEVALDEMANQLNMDPVQLRLVNYANEEPQKNKQFSSKYLKECYQRGAEMIGWDKRSAKPGSQRDGKYLVGYGMATATYPANRSDSSAKAIIFADGHAEIQAAGQDLGTGTYTVMTQIAADAFGLPIDKVVMKLGDSKFPKAAGSGGSQLTASVGPPIRAAALGAKSKMIKMAIADARSPLSGQKEEDIMVDNGRLYIKNNTGTGETFATILSRQGLKQIEAKAETKVSTRKKKESSPPPKGSKEALLAAESKANPAVQEDENVDREPYAFHSFGAHFVKVLVDPDLGTAHVDKAVAVMDVGTVMNEKTAINQIMGGMIFGIGMALMEEVRYDPNRGRIVTRDLANYLVPVHADMPDFEVAFINKPDTIISPIGARGIGEIGITGITAAVTNAIYNATGKRVRDLPATPDKLMS